MSALPRALESPLCLLVVLDAEARILDCNQAFELVTGYELTRISGRVIWDILAPEGQREDWKPVYERVLAGRGIPDREAEWVIRSGERLTVGLSAFLNAAEPASPKILLTAVDLTEFISARHELRRLATRERTILENLAAALSVRDSAGRFTFVNRRFREIFGVCDAVIEGKTAEEVFAPALAARFVALRELVDEFGSPRLVEEVIEVGGKELELATSTFPLSDADGSSLGICTISDDRTQFNVSERTLRLRTQDVADLSQKLISSQEDERRRLARDLHDGVNQEIASLSVELGMLAASAPREVTAALKELGARAMSISDQVRRLSHQVHPAALEALGLADALRSFARETAKRRGVNLTSEINGVGADVPLFKATCIYRVAQEAVNNAIKYANADNLNLTVRSDGEQLTLEVSDDGKGFDPSAAVNGIGLIGMQERARIAGGQLRVWSEPGQGTRITLEAPLRES